MYQENQEKSETKINLLKKLLEIQRDLKVEKGQWNSFGKYKYRSKEDILEAVKPICHEHNVVVLCDDDVIEIDGWKYILCTARIVDTESMDEIGARGLAREPESKRGMDSSQITGTAASYAGKRALGNLFAIDDTKDSDAISGKQQDKKPPVQGAFTAHCQNCGTRYQFQDKEQYDNFVLNAACCPSPNWMVD